MTEGQAWSCAHRLAPDGLLPDALREESPLGRPRRVDARYELQR
ncbi:MAG TPA: hypothetical protein VH561_16505 [Micromonosporaceae bacterium]